MLQSQAQSQDKANFHHNTTIIPIDLMFHDFCQYIANHTTVTHLRDHKQFLIDQAFTELLFNRKQSHVLLF